MASTYSTLKLQLMTTGENTSTWGNVTNLNLGTALEEAIVGSADVTFASATVTLALTDTNASQTARNLRLNLIGTSGGAQNLIVPAIEKVYLVNNGCADAITVKNSSGTGIAVPAGKVMWVYNDGTNVTNAVTHLTSLTLAAALPVLSGGTGVTTSTGSGNVVLSTSPTLVTPLLGTPTSGTLTNCTGVSLTAGVTGTLPVANGGTGVTSSTGSGNNVLSTSPTLVTPALGTPSSGNLTNCTGMSGLQSTQTTGTWTVPSNVVSSTRVKFRLVGGGGGGGGAATVTNATGAGGASGDYIEAVFSGFTAGQNVTASIGAAGAAGSASGGAGGDGGDTTLTYNSVTICLASRGFGGAGATTTAMTAPGTVYATSVASAGASGLTDVSSTVVNSRGAGTAGSYPVFANAGQSYISGTGGSNPMGNGGYGMVNGAPGIDATGYGGGGSGGSRAAATNRAGGAGAAGCVFVEYVL